MCVCVFSPNAEQKVSHYRKRSGGEHVVATCVAATASVRMCSPAVAGSKRFRAVE